MNHITLTGRLTDRPVLRELPDGGTVCRLRLAVDGMAPGRETGYVNVTEFGPRATAAAEYLKKGSLVAVSGRMEWHDWEDDNGRRREAHQIVGEIKFLANLRTAQERGREVEQRHEQTVEQSAEPPGLADRELAAPVAEQLAARASAAPAAVAGIER